MPGFEMQRLGVVMEPEPGNPLEAEGVLNPAAVRGPDGQLYLFPRMVAAGNYSRIGIARVQFNGSGDPTGVERLGIALEPEADYELPPDESGGCEDPRITFGEDIKRYVMTYTAFSSKGPRIALAISEDLFHWERLGLATFCPYQGIDFDGVDDKDASIFPVAIHEPDGQPAMAILHRPLFPGTRPEETASKSEPRAVDLHRESIWISYCPLATENQGLYHLCHFTAHQRLAGPVASWERLKIGAGAPPILCRHGWLVVYHGVGGTGKPTTGGRRDLRYSAGVMVLSETQPRIIRYRSRHPVLTADSPQERNGIVANVVFPTGIDRRDDLGLPDRFDVYYGMADDRIGVARLDVPESLPQADHESKPPHALERESAGAGGIVTVPTIANESDVRTPRSTPTTGNGTEIKSASIPSKDKSLPVNVETGLTSEEARRRLKQFGPNAVPDTSLHPFRMALDKFWAPVPWMLEAAIVLQVVLGEYVEAAIIGALLVFNAVLGFFQEGRAQATLAALKSRLALSAAVRRDGVWTNRPAAELVPGDVVKLSLGTVVAADVRLVQGDILLDQSMLTGESIPIEASPGFQTFAGALVRRGEAVAEVTATGTRTKFGRTAELVLSAHVVSSQQKAVLRVVRNLALFNGSLIVLLVAYAAAHAMPVAEIIPLVLTAVLASIPVALPATFTLAAAVGARSLAHLGVLPTRLSAVDEAASMDVLCVDKTGTLTQNELTVNAVRPSTGFDDAHVLGLAALAGSDGGQDPVDAAIRAAAAHKVAADLPKGIAFVPFDPATKMSEATVVDAKGAKLRVVKGAFAVVAGLIPSSPTDSTAANELESQGFRVLAVAVGPPQALRLSGIIALSDPPRIDSAKLVAELRTLGVRTVMATGDAAVTAAIVARAVGLEGAVCPPGSKLDRVRPEDFAVFAGVLPEDKYHLVKAFQNEGHIVGMCGDGANDAPALRQAQMGIAVSTATDVAKSAAGIVLTEPGLVGIVAAVKEGRVTFQRILTYTLNSVNKKVVQVLFLAAGLIMTGHAILTPMLMVIVMITGDFLGMSLTTDNVRPSPLPNAWRIGKLTIAGVFMGISELVFCSGVLAVGEFGLEFNIGALRTLAFLLIVFGNQATTYAIRERRRLWSSPPSSWLVVSSVADLMIASTLAVCGIFMTALPIVVVANTFAATIAFAFLVDAAKGPVFRRLGIA